MKKIKRIAKVIVTILILIIALLIVYEIYIRYDGNLDKTNIMSRDDMIELVKKGTEYNNYSITFKPSIFTRVQGGMNLTQKIYVKDNVVKKITDNRSWEYIDFDKNEHIYIFSYPTVYITEISSYDRYIGTSYEAVTNKDNYEIVYLGEKEINDRQIFVIKVIYKNDSSKSYEKMYIDKQTGVAINIEHYAYIGPILIRISERREVEFDSVTDEDVKRPNIVGSVVYDYRNN